jgi:2-oxoglutarate ferredoxin oxidoreductase subunit alpha
VQEMNDFVEKGFDLAFKYRTPVMILADGIIGQMMEKVWLSEEKPRLTEEQIIEKYGDWATTGKKRATRNIVTSVNLEATVQEAFNRKLQAKYARIRKEEVIFEEIQCEDAEFVFVAFGTSARICLKSVEILRENGIKVGLLRPITLFPFPTEKLAELSKKVKGFMVIEMNAGQMLEDVKLAANGNTPVEFYGRMGGVIPTPVEVVEAFQKTFLK